MSILLTDTHAWFPFLVISTTGFLQVVCLWLMSMDSLKLVQDDFSWIQFWVCNLSCHPLTQKSIKHFTRKVVSSKWFWRSHDWGKPFIHIALLPPCLIRSQEIYLWPWLREGSLPLSKFNYQEITSKSCLKRISLFCFFLFILFKNSTKELLKTARTNMYNDRGEISVLLKRVIVHQPIDVHTLPL